MRSVALAVALALPGPALAWNDKGHMVGGRLAWNQLSEQQRAKVVAVLRMHPHFEEFLAAKRPHGIHRRGMGVLARGDLVRLDTQPPQRRVPSRAVALHQLPDC